MPDHPHVGMVFQAELLRSVATVSRKMDMIIAKLMTINDTNLANTKYLREILLHFDSINELGLVFEMEPKEKEAIDD